MVEAVSGWSVTFEARIRSEISYLGFVVALRQVFFFFRGTATFSCQYCSTFAPYPFIFDERYVSG
jgi:hypothetical protein